MWANGLPHCLVPPQSPASAFCLQPGLQTPHARLSTATTGVPSNAGIATTSNAGASGYNRGQSSSLNVVPGGAGGSSAAGLHSSARDPSVAGGGVCSERSVPMSMMATHGSATPMPNIATSSVGSAATTFTTATNMSLHTGAAQVGTSVPPTIVSGAVSTSAEEDGGAGVVGVSRVVQDKGALCGSYA